MWWFVENKIIKSPILGAFNYYLFRVDLNFTQRDHKLGHNPL